jgi:malate dehydrogenase (oxaloacetate-decarboxylating)(NADP+)
MANPDPEISYHDAKAARPDLIMGTGRSDFPNQVNNVSGFPYIFRGALDVRATAINEEMKLAAARSLAALAREVVPHEICDAYGVKNLSFGIDYVIPKALDTRMLVWEAPAVAKTAMDTGVAQIAIDLERYKKDLRKRLDNSQKRINEYVKSYHFSF